MAQEQTFKYEPAEDTTSLTLTPLVRRIKAQLRGLYPNIETEELHNLVHESLKVFTINEQTFEYIRKGNTIVDYQWYFLCPKCGKHVRILHLPEKLKNREQKYLCKICHRLKNRSALMGRSREYLAVRRPLKRLERLKEALVKMRPSNPKVKILLDEYQRIRDEMRSTADYRLWEFKQKFGK